MFFKLAKNNVKKSLKEYLIYFLTIVFGVCIFYVFNSIDSQQAMLNLSESQHKLVKLLIDVIGGVSIFISVILAFLIIYANKFLIKRRKKEFGVYLTLGMKKSSVSKIVIFETLIIGVISLVIGLLLGVFLSQWLSILTASLFEVSLKSLEFTFSLAALEKTILYFAIIYFIVILFNTISISKYKLVDLIYASKKNEKLKFKNIWVAVIIFVISLATLVLAYNRILVNGLTDLDSKLLVTIILGIIGTFGIFFSLAGFLLEIIKLSKKLYYKNLNLFILKQINSKINTNFISMSLVCLMLFITIMFLSSGLALEGIFSNGLAEATPYDATVIMNNRNGDINFNIENSLTQNGVNVEHLIKSKSIINLYSYDKLTYEDITRGVDEKTRNSLKYFLPQSIDLIKLSEYNGNLELLGKEKLSLKNNEFIVLCNIEKIKPYLTNFLNSEGKIDINNNSYIKKSTELLDIAIMNNISKQTVAVILPDNVFENMISKATLMNVYYSSKVNQTEVEFINSIDKALDLDDMGTITKIGMYEQNLGLKVMIIYITIYIGIVFLITSAAVLALQQLTDISDSMQRYEILRKIGVEDNRLNKSVFIQILIYFALPMLLAVIHSIIGIIVVNDTLVLLGENNVLTNILAVGGAILIIYTVYLIATYVTAKSVIKNKV